MCPCVSVHRVTSLFSLFLLLQLCPALLVVVLFYGISTLFGLFNAESIHFDIQRARVVYSTCSTCLVHFNRVVCVLLPRFVQDSTQHPCVTPIYLFSKSLLSVQVVQPYSSTDTATAWKKFRFILSIKSDFYMINDQSIAVHAFPMRILTSLSVDEILLPRYVKWSSNFRGLSKKLSAKT